MENNILIITAKSGVGKTSLMKNLRKAFPDLVRFIPSYTTKPRRIDDSDEDYEFMTRDQCDEAFHNQELLFRTEQQGNYYGLRVEKIRQAIDDVEHLHVRSLTPDILNLLRACAPDKTCFIHLAAPSDKELRRRLLARGDHPASITRKLKDEKLWDLDIEIMKLKGFDINILSGNMSQEEVLTETIKLLRL